MYYPISENVLSNIRKSIETTNIQIVYHWHPIFRMFSAARYNSGSHAINQHLFTHHHLLSRKQYDFAKRLVGYFRLDLDYKLKNIQAGFINIRHNLSSSESFG